MANDSTVTKAKTDSRDAGSFWGKHWIDTPESAGSGHYLAVEDDSAVSGGTCEDSIQCKHCQQGYMSRRGLWDKKNRDAKAHSARRAFSSFPHVS